LQPRSITSNFQAEFALEMKPFREKLSKLKNMRELLKEQAKLWKQFLPLSVSDVTMALGDPAITFTLANLPFSRENLASVGAAKSIVVFFESPIIMILHASNTLATSRRASRLLWQFTKLAMLLLTAMLIVMNFPGTFRWLASKGLNFNSELILRTQMVLVPLIIWPAAIAWRRFHQGLLIRAGHSRCVANAGLGRISILVVALFIGFLLRINGAAVAGLSLAAGIIGEALLVTWMAKRKNAFPSSEPIRSKALPNNLKEIWRFYWPLANSMLVVWGGRALLLVVIARAIDAPIALAVWPAAWGLVVLIGNATRMVQQVVIRNRGTIPDWHLLMFAGSVGIACSATVICLVASELGRTLVAHFIGNDKVLEASILLVLLNCSAVPFLISIQNAAQGFLIGDGMTGRINASTYFGTAALLSASYLAVRNEWGGTNAASIGIVLSIAIETAILAWSLKGKLVSSPSFASE
jgi:hypothetical protein